MGEYRYNPESALTRWQQEKVRDLCDERHPILSRLRSEQERPGDRALLRHIERQIDWYQMKEFKPTLDYHRKRLRGIQSLIRKTHRLIDLARPPAQQDGETKAVEWLYCPRNCRVDHEPVRLVPGQRCPECREVALP